MSSKMRAESERDTVIERESDCKTNEPDAEREIWDVQERINNNNNIIDVLQSRRWYSTGLYTYYLNYTPRKIHSRTAIKPSFSTVLSPATLLLNPWLLTAVDIRFRETYCPVIVVVDKII